MALFPLWLKEKQQYVDALLVEHLPKMPNELDRLNESIQYSLLGGGKRLRPLLMIATLETLNFKVADAKQFIMAIEMIHCYSLIHDDLPCMDDDEFRRGKKTNHIVFGENMAVLAGDALLTEAFRIVSQPNTTLQSDLQLEAINILANHAGWGGMVGGQSVDIQNLNDQEHTDQMLQFIHKNKTGQLIQVCLAIPTILANLDEKEKKRFIRIGDILGQMFQVQDDLLDVLGSEKTLGKGVLKDQKMNKLTYPSLYGVQQTQKILKGLNEQVNEMINALNYDGDRLLDFSNLFYKRTK